MHLVDVKEQKIKNKENVEFTVDFQAPQCNDLPELIQFFGTEKEIVDRMNKAIARAAVQMPKLRLANTTEKTFEELADKIKKEQEAAASYKPDVGGGISKNEAKTGVDRLSALSEKNQDVFNQLTGPEALEYIKTGKLPEKFAEAVAVAA